MGELRLAGDLADCSHRLHIALCHYSHSSLGKLSQTGAQYLIARLPCPPRADWLSKLGTLIANMTIQPSHLHMLEQLMSTTATATGLIRWFDQIGLEDVASVGGKNASLGEMYRELTPKGIRVPNGFATTADAYRLFLQESGLDEKIAQILSGMQENDVDSLHHHGLLVRHAILETPLPESLSRAIVVAYHDLSLSGMSRCPSFFKAGKTLSARRNATYPESKPKICTK